MPRSPRPTSSRVSRQEDSAGIEDAWRERFGRPRPGKIVCVGLNYRTHALETNAELPGRPLLFAKFANAASARASRSASGRRRARGRGGRAGGSDRRARRAGTGRARARGRPRLHRRQRRERARLPVRRRAVAAGKGFDSFCPILADVVTAPSWAPPETCGRPASERRGVQDADEHLIFESRARRLRVGCDDARAGRPHPHRHARRGRLLPRSAPRAAPGRRGRGGGRGDRHLRNPVRVRE